MTTGTLDERLKIYGVDEPSDGKRNHAFLYAATALAGAGAILVPPPAEAAIVYTNPVDKTVSAGAPFQTVNFDGEGSADFNFSFYTSGGATNYLNITIPGSGSVVAIGSNSFPANVAEDTLVSSGAAFVTESVFLLAGKGASVTYGNFLDSAEGSYLGVKFTLATGTHYGWIQFKASADASVGTILDWAYEDIPDTAIKAGDVGKKFNWNLFLPAIIAGANK